MTSRIVTADVLDALRQMPAESVHCVVTSPPYWGLRAYLGLSPTRWGDGTECCLGSEPTPDAFVRHIVEVFDEVRRVLRQDGVCWVNLGDTYSNTGVCGGGSPVGDRAYRQTDRQRQAEMQRSSDNYGGLDHGNLLGVPWRCALALQQSGWSLRSEVLWHKASAMPQSVNGARWERCRVKVGLKPWRGGSGRNGAPESNFDGKAVEWSDCPGCDKCRDNAGYILRRGAWRPTLAHEPIFMLTKGMDYFADRDAVATPLSSATVNRDKYTRILDDPDEQFGVAHDHESLGNPAGANMRTVRTFNRSGPKYEFCYACRRLYVGPEVRQGMTKRACPACGKKDWIAHYAAFPLSLPATFIKASCSEAWCCAECGAQWARVVSESYSQPTNSICGRRDGGPDERGWDGFPRLDRTSTTLGFRPACCHTVKAKPVVLDPFAGTGTTLIAALAHGCEALGIEGSPQYAALAEARLARWKVFAELAEVDREKTPCVGQREMFG